MSDMEREDLRCMPGSMAPSSLSGSSTLGVSLSFFEASSRTRAPRRLFFGSNFHFVSVPTHVSGLLL